MRWTIAAAALFAASPLAAEDVAVDSAVYVERAGADGTRQVEPATRLMRGDRVVTILRWEAPPPNGRFTATSAVPPQLAIESTTATALEVSADGGRTWRRLADPQRVPAGTTHLRWRLGAGEGRMSYRAVVR